MTKQTIFSIIIIVLVAAGLIVFTVWSKKHPISTPTNNPPVTTTTDDSKYLVTKEPTNVSVAEDSYLLGIGGSYPQFSQADASFNSKIQKTVTDATADFKKNANDDYQARLQTGGDEFKKQFEQGGMYTLSWKTDVVQSNDRYISVIIREESYSGGAHGSVVATSFNYDVKNQKELALTDFMTLEKASTVSRASLKVVFEKNGDTDTFNSFALDGTDPKKPENFSVFTFTNDTVTVYFSEYQVAPYVYGEQQVEIPRAQ